MSAAGATGRGTGLLVSSCSAKVTTQESETSGVIERPDLWLFHSGSKELRLFKALGVNCGVYQL